MTKTSDGPAANFFLSPSAGLLRTPDAALHNVVELEPLAGGGVLLRRIPRHVAETLSPLGRMVAEESAGVELRFVTASTSFRLTLSALPSVLQPYESNGHEVIVFRGGFLHSRHRIESGRPNHLQVINHGGAEPFDRLGPDHRRACGFSPEVWRIFFGRYPAVYHGLETFGHGVRPPTAAEVPSRRWLAYGSSITCGAGASLHHQGYVYHAARRLGVDVINLGLSGSCCCEPEMAAFLADRDDWDLATLEVGVNMRQSHTTQRFRHRVEHLLDRLSEAHPRKAMTLITIYPNAATPGWSAGVAADGEPTRREAAFNDVLRELVASDRFSGLRLIEGGTVLREPGDLTMDLIHPSDYGHARMGEALAEALRVPSHREPAKASESDLLQGAAP